jgi:hypothetical protein
MTGPLTRRHLTRGRRKCAASCRSERARPRAVRENARWLANLFYWIDRAAQDLKAS